MASDQRNHQAEQEHPNGVLHGNLASYVTRSVAPLRGNHIQDKVAASFQAVQKHSRRAKRQTKRHVRGNTNGRKANVWCAG